MKKRNIVIHCLVLLLLIATFAACASTPERESAGEYVDDSVITTKVKSLLAADDFLKSFEKGELKTTQTGGFEMEQTLIKTIELSNGLKLYFYDISRKLAGDRWYVGVIARIDIPLIDSLLTNQHLSHFSVEEIRNALGESVRFEQKENVTISTSGKKMTC
jgi:hypothetical protein